MISGSISICIHRLNRPVFLHNEVFPVHGSVFIPIFDSFEMVKIFTIKCASIFHRTKGEVSLDPRLQLPDIKAGLLTTKSGRYISRPPVIY